MPAERALDWAAVHRERRRPGDGPRRGPSPRVVGSIHGNRGGVLMIEGHYDRADLEDMLRSLGRYHFARAVRAR